MSVDYQLEHNLILCPLTNICEQVMFSMDIYNQFHVWSYMDHNSNITSNIISLTSCRMRLVRQLFMQPVVKDMLKS